MVLIAASYSSTSGAPAGSSHRGQRDPGHHRCWSLEHVKPWEDCPGLVNTTDCLWWNGTPYEWNNHFWGESCIIVDLQTLLLYFCWTIGWLFFSQRFSWRQIQDFSCPLNKHRPGSVSGAAVLLSSQTPRNLSLTWPVGPLPRSSFTLRVKETVVGASLSRPPFF